MSIVWNSKKMAEGLALTQSTHAEIMVSMKELLDDYHGTPRLESYYDLIAGDWLDKFLHVAYVAWQNVLAGELLQKKYPVRTFDNLETFNVLTFGPDFHDYLQSIVERLLAGESPESWLFDRKESHISIGEGRWSKKALRCILGSNHPSVIFCLPYAIRCSRKEWVSTLWRWRRWAKWDDFDYPVNVSCRIDQDWRRRRSVSEMPIKDFSGLLRALLPLVIPVVLLEGFTLFRHTVLGLKLWRPKVLYTAIGLLEHLTFKVLAAEWRKEGTVLLGHQHGGNYGLDRIHTLEDYETRVVDRYYTWGWQRSDRSVRPMSPPYQGIYRQTPRRILLFLADFYYPDVVYRLHFQPSIGTIETQVKNSKAFLSALPKNDALLVRLMPSDPSNLKLKAIFQSSAPWAAFDEKYPRIFQRYAESRLVVHNYLSSTFLETLALDIPTICFFDPDTYVFRKEGGPHISAMEKIGILHRSGVDAAQFAKSVMIDPQVWWQKSEVQEVRHAVLGQYANFSPDWATQWETEFQQWID